MLSIGGIQARSFYRRIGTLPQKPEDKIANMIRDTGVEVDFRFKVTCEGWKEGEIVVSDTKDKILYDKKGNKITQRYEEKEGKKVPQPLLKVKVKLEKPAKGKTAKWKLEVIDEIYEKTKKGELKQKQVLKNGVIVQEKEPCKQRSLIHPGGKKKR